MEVLYSKTHVTPTIFIALQITNESRYEGSRQSINYTNLEKCAKPSKKNGNKELSYCIGATAHVAPDSLH